MLPYLSLAIWVPIAAGLLVLAVNRDRDAPVARWLALVGAVAGFAVTIPLYTQFTLGTAEMQFVEAVEWIPRFSVNYLLGVDGISVLLILLNSFITVLAVWAGWEVIETRVAQYMAAFLIQSGLINGVFAALDAVLFYVFFEAMLIPMYLTSASGAAPTASTRRSISSCTVLVSLLVARSICTGRQLLDPRVVSAAAVAQDAGMAVRRLLHRVCRQGADVAGAHVAARRARRSADRRLGRPRRHHA